MLCKFPHEPIENGYFTLWQTYKKLLKIAIEIVDSPIKHGGSFHSYVAVYQAGYIYTLWLFNIAMVLININHY